MTKTATVEIALTETQRRALAEHLKDRRRYEILVTAMVIFALLLGSVAQVRPAPAPVFALLVVVVAVGLVTATAIASYRKFQFDARRAQIVNRTTGDLEIETIYNDEGPDFRFIEVDGRKVKVDKEIPHMRVGTIEYTPKRGHLVAIWDRDGILAWCAPGYEPSPADRMQITA